MFGQLIKQIKDHIAPTYLQPHYVNGVFGNVYLLALDNTKTLLNIAGAPLP